MVFEVCDKGGYRNRLLREPGLPLRTARVLLRLASRPSGFRVSPMHPLALGGGPLASLRVLCPERFQRQGEQGDFNNDNHQRSNRTAEQPHQPDPSWRLHQRHATDASEQRRFHPHRSAVSHELSRSHWTHHSERCNEDWLKPAMAQAYRVLEQDRVAIMFYW